jgi:hypothetical protein
MTLKWRVQTRVSRASAFAPIKADHQLDTSFLISQRPQINIMAPYEAKKNQNSPLLSKSSRNYTPQRPISSR